MRKFYSLRLIKNEYPEKVWPFLIIFDPKLCVRSDVHPSDKRSPLLEDESQRSSSGQVVRWRSLILCDLRPGELLGVARR